jgi:hypothetical protein
VLADQILGEEPEARCGRVLGRCAEPANTEGREAGRGDGDGRCAEPDHLIPDFVPVLSYLDDLVIVPSGIALAVRLSSAALMTAFRAEAAVMKRPVNRAIAVAIVGLWVVAGLGAAVWCWTRLR